MPGYKVEQDTQIGGKAPKWIIRGPSGEDDFYIAKFGVKNGYIEVYTELFNNMVGEALGFDVAHHGLVKLGDHRYFLTRNFRRDEALIHGSLIVADVMATSPEELEFIGHGEEQSFYSIDFLWNVLQNYCGEAFDVVSGQFAAMLLFDALIGSQDRHAQNWGLLVPEKRTPDGIPAMRLAPLFDSARALLWDLPEGKLLMLDADEAALSRYVQAAKPCIGPSHDHPKTNKCNHLDFIKCLYDLYPHHIEEAFAIIADKDIGRIARHILTQFPFSRGFSSLRKRVIVKVLNKRAQLLRAALGKEEMDGLVNTIQNTSPAFRSVV